MNGSEFASPVATQHARHTIRLLATITALLSWCAGAYAQQPQPLAEAGIVVTGDGSVDVPPSYAQIRIGVTTRTKTVKEGVGTNSNLMTLIMGALKDAGVAANDIQTARFSIQPIYAPVTTLGSRDSHAEPKLSGYDVSNHVNVTVRQLGKVGDLIDRAVAAGATDVGNISFVVSDASKALDQAREAAFADARRKADVYANTSGVHLGRVEWITEETGSGPPGVMPMARTAAAAVPIAAGEDTLRVRVTVGFQIAR